MYHPSSLTNYTPKLLIYSTVYVILYYILREGVIAVPKYIREVARPVNTVVIDNGKDGPTRYAVRERKSVKYVAGGNPQPQNGKVIGHIVDGAYVPKGVSVVNTVPDMLSYGSAAFAHSVADDLMSELLRIYDATDAFRIMAIAMLRVIRPGIAMGRLSTHYQRTFVSVFYPGVALSANSVCEFYKRLGFAGAQRRAFYQLRTAAVMADHHIAIDGTLKQDSSDVNDLSKFSYKAKKKGHKEVSVLYAYDIEAMEPICAELFPGNNTDAAAYSTFIRDNDIKRGIIVADKGFPPSSIKDELTERPDLHFLTPIKRNDTRIANNDMLAFEGVLSGVDDHVVYKKKSIKGGHFLYSYKSSKKARAEESSYLARRENNKDFDADKYAKKKELFGVIVFESDQDLDPETAYICYDDRWLLELVFNKYKSDECLDKTDVQGDFSVIGSEFINFISTVITCRLIKKAREAGLLAKMSYGDLMEDLSSAWRMVDSPAEPETGDGKWVHTLKPEFEELEALGLSKPIPQPVAKKRGRPRKHPIDEKPRKQRGRPRKGS